MANKNTNPGSGKDDNEMRIQFGLILALCQNCAILHNPLFYAQNSNLFKLLSPMFPRCFKTSLAFHDRFLIIDGKELYLIGASLKDLGRKGFGFTKMDAGEIAGIRARVQ